MKEDYTPFIIMAIVFLFAVALGVGATAYREGIDTKTQIIYLRCLDKNGTLAYNDAMKLCKDLVK